MRRRRWRLAVVAVLVLGGVWLLLASRGPSPLVVDAGTVTRRAQFQSTVSASGEIVATRYADIGASAMGKIVSLPVVEGDRVKAGQVLARIDAVRAQTDASGATAQLRALEAEERGAAEQIRMLEAELAAAEAREREATQQLARKSDLSQRRLLPAAELETARADAAAATAQAAGARAGVSRARHTMAAAARRVAQANAQLLSASDTLSKTSIVSPIDGIVSRLRVREGEMVVMGIQNQPGTTLMTISDLSAIDAEVKVAEADVLRLARDQRAMVTLEAVPGKRFPGRVVEIGASALPVAGTGAAAREFKVVVRLDAPEPGLRPGLTCDAEIVTSERSNVLTVPLQSVVLRGPAGEGERSGVFGVAGGRARFTPVTPGVIGGLDIEVTGISERAAIVIGPYQALRALEDGVLIRVAPAGGRR